MRKFFSVLTAILLFCALIALCGNFMLYVYTGPAFLEYAYAQMDSDGFALSIAEGMSQEVPGVKIDVRVAEGMGEDLWHVLLSVSSYIRGDAPQVNWSIDYRAMKEMMLAQLGDEEVFTAFLIADGSAEALAILAAPADQFQEAHQAFMEVATEELTALPDWLPLPELMGGSVQDWNQGLEVAKEIMAVFNASFKALLFIIAGLMLIQLPLAREAALSRTGWAVFWAGLVVMGLALAARLLSSITGGGMMSGLDMQRVFFAVNMVQLMTGAGLLVLGLLLLLIGKFLRSALKPEVVY